MKTAFVLVALLFVGCSGEPEEAKQDLPLTGVVVDVESSGLNEVTSFELRHDDTTTTIYIDEEVDYGFPLGHLHEHKTSGGPVRVEGTERDGKLYASSIEDVET